MSTKTSPNGNRADSWFDHNDEVYVVRSTQCPGCLTYSEKGYDEALKFLDEALTKHLEHIKWLKKAETY